MRNFLILIRRFWNIIFFVLLEIICFYLIAKSRSMQGVDIISSSNAVAGFVYKTQDNVSYYFRLKKINKDLLSENAELRNQLDALTGIDSFKDLRVNLPVYALDSSRVDSLGKPIPGSLKVVKHNSYVYIPARVIKNSVTDDRINFLTINRGEKDGIKKGMSVVTFNGIVGRVEYTSESYATVASVLSDRKVSAKLRNGEYSTVYWDGKSPEYVWFEKIPHTVKTQVGDSVFTSNLSSFPEDILIGKVAKIDTQATTNTKNLKVRLSTNFRNLQYVYVTDDKMKGEQEALEEKTKATKRDPL